MVGQPLGREAIAVVVDAGLRRAQLERDVFEVAQRRDRFGDPSLGRFAVDLSGIRHPAAPMGRLLQKEHPAPRATGGQRRRKPGDSSSCNKDIDGAVEVLVGVGIAVPRSLPQPGGLADEGLEKMFPQRARVDERLVVEARRQELRQPVVENPDIALERRPVVLTARLETVEEFGGGSACVGFEALVSAEVQQRVRLFGAVGDDPPGAVIFEASPDEELIVRQQGGGDGIALKPLHLPAVEAECQGLGAVDEAAAIDA